MAVAHSKTNYSVGQRLAVFSVKKTADGAIWNRAGSAFINSDGSINVLLDVLPIDGRLHIREPREDAKRESGEGERKAG